jgi:hypothetical protein
MEARAECMRIARKLRLTGGTVFGLVPVDKETDIPDIRLQVRDALTELLGQVVDTIDATSRADLEEKITRIRHASSFALVDFTGFDSKGELESALDLVDRAILVATAGKTREADILEMNGRLPEIGIGVLLIG